MTQKTPQNPWQFDVRVRERNLKQGSLTEKDLEKYLVGLPDLEPTTEAFGTPQPALEQPRVVAPPAPISADFDDEEEDEDDEDEDDVEETAAAAPAPVAAAAEPPAAEAPAAEPAAEPTSTDTGAGES